MSGIVVELQNKIVLKSILGTQTEIGHIKMRRAFMKDMLGLDFSPAFQQESLLILVSRLSGISRDVLERMEASDWVEVTHAVNSLLTKGSQ